MNVFIKVKHILLLFTIALLFYSCYEDAVDFNFNELGSSIVIEGIITDQTGINSIIITKTAPVNSGELPAPVTQASVTILDDSGNMEVLAESSAGIYRINQISGIPGTTYELHVLTEGREYFGSSIMPQPITFDSVRFVRVSPSHYYHNVTIYFTDPSEQETYALIKFWINNNNHPLHQTLYHDHYSDGENIALQYEMMPFSFGDHVVIEILSLDRVIYEYFSALLEVDEYVEPEMPDFYEIVGYNPRSNLQNGALGYFSAQSIRRYYYTIQ